MIIEVLISVDRLFLSDITSLYQIIFYFLFRVYFNVFT